MGGRGTAAERNNSSSSSVEKPKTITNAQGFDVENSDNPDIEFSKLTWEHMAELRKLGGFEDDDLRRLVDDRISEILEEYDDLSRYNADLTNVIEHIQGDNVTDDEYWAGYHVAADYLNISQRRYTVLDSNMSAWDGKYSSVEQAEAWANEHNDAVYVYDTWQNKYRKVGGKSWRR